MAAVKHKKKNKKKYKKKKKAAVKHKKKNKKKYKKKKMAAVLQDSKKILQERYPPYSCSRTNILFNPRNLSYIYTTHTRI